MAMVSAGETGLAAFMSERKYTPSGRDVNIEAVRRTPASPVG
jgi:hypothetical protein